MCAWNSGIKVADLDIKKLMTAIAADVPVGEGKNRSRSDLWLGHKRIIDHIADVEKKVEEAKEFCKTLDYPAWCRAKIQIGTLGGGNHFIELQQDAEGNAWFMLHSGSRGFGAQLAKKFHHLAVKTCKRYYTRLPNEELAFLPADSDEGQWYIASLLAAQDYALVNRKLMMICCQEAVREQYHQTAALKDIINIHHNYATIEHHHGENVWVHRKGATLARKTTVGIIPGSMCSKSYIVKGKENPDSFNSCSHGAGRNFSRTTAKKRIADGLDPSQASQLGSVELYGVQEAHDELGSAYKSIDVVMNNQKDLVDIQIELLPVAVLKG
jgi:tRNA-splicing ligase RtcB